MSGTLDGRVVIITGAGRGIGASVSRRFAEQGAKLVVNDLGAGPDGTGGDEGPAHDIADEIVEAGGEAVSDGGDIADTATGKRLVENVAGILRDKMIVNLDDEDWDAVIPSAATRLTATIPQDKQLGSSERPADDDSRSPDNIAPLGTDLASEASDWISGRTLGPAGHGVTLWNNPEVRASIASDGPWDLDDLAAKMEREFRPLADGLHPSIFMGQVPK